MKSTVLLIAVGAMLSPVLRAQTARDAPAAPRATVTTGADGGSTITVTRPVVTNDGYRTALSVSTTLGPPTDVFARTPAVPAEPARAFPPMLVYSILGLIVFVALALRIFSRRSDKKAREG